MAEPKFDRTWIILSSTSRLFPVDSELVLTPKQPDGFEVKVIWEGSGELKLVEKAFRKVETGTLEWSLDHPKKQTESFQLVVTFCPVPGPSGKNRLFGLLLQTGRIESGGTGVWVAEEKPGGKPGGPPEG